MSILHGFESSINHETRYNMQAFFKALADLERFRVSAYPRPSALPFILKCETDSWTQENLNN